MATNRSARPERLLDVVHVKRRLAKPHDVRPHPPTAPQRGQTSATWRSSSHSLSLPQSSQRAFNSSPCIWMTSREPACSWRLSMFCVTSVKAPPRCGQRRGEPRQREMRGVRRRVAHVAPPLVVEGENGLGIALEGFDARKLHRVETTPDPLAPLVAERAEAAFGRNAGPARTRCCLPCPIVSSAERFASRCRRSGVRSPSMMTNRAAADLERRKAPRVDPVKTKSAERCRRRSAL